MRWRRRLHDDGTGASQLTTQLTPESSMAVSKGYRVILICSRMFVFCREENAVLRECMERIVWDQKWC